MSEWVIIWEVPSEIYLKDLRITAKVIQSGEPVCGSEFDARKSWVKKRAATPHFQLSTPINKIYNFFRVRKKNTRGTDGAVSTRRILSSHPHLTISMELSHSEATSWSARQQVLNILWKPKFYYRVHKSPPVVPILSQDTTPSYISNMSLIIPPIVRLPSGLFPSGFLKKTVYAFLSSGCYMPCPSHAP
jgi:hypothetical protein